ncbi:hypothetical protein LOTGIDRAFT_166539 [Lottia gigantea]|uniref:Uncharacterized protein n=1 Tax=Lottia gigantea TaxID=225164 RepID=V3ZSS2_LOTGI|nr:hypothetical protein LOTGIDRAFT_166539 [Lottia gigantea]ESO87392.1 hypothetical protein LOTGIDRAFT_166539 [Lottia gigantea]
MTYSVRRSRIASGFTQEPGICIGKTEERVEAIHDTIFHVLGRQRVEAVCDTTERVEAVGDESMSRSEQAERVEAVGDKMLSPSLEIGGVKDQVLRLQLSTYRVTNI